MPLAGRLTKQVHDRACGFAVTGVMKYRQSVYVMRIRDILCRRLHATQAFDVQVGNSEFYCVYVCVCVRAIFNRSQNIAFIFNKCLELHHVRCYAYSKP